MQSEWRISSMYLGDEQVFQVYRLRDVNAVDHAGNREYRKGMFYNEDEAQAQVDWLNGLGTDVEVASKVQ